MKTFVMGLLLHADDVVLLQKTHPPEQAGRYNGPGGEVGKAEEPSDAMEREFFEETGLRVPAADWRLLVRMVPDDYTKEVLVYTSRWPDVEPLHLPAPDNWSPQDERPVVKAVAFALQFLHLVPDLQWLLPLASFPLTYRPFSVVKVATPQPVTAAAG